jgi:hypothetical protein
VRLNFLERFLGVADGCFEAVLPLCGCLVDRLTECEVFSELDLLFELGLDPVLVELIKPELGVL